MRSYNTIQLCMYVYAVEIQTKKYCLLCICVYNFIARLKIAFEIYL